MVWYIAILAAMAATVYAYRQRRSIHRLGNDEVGDLGRLLGTDFGVALTGSITLLCVLLFVLLSNPSDTVLRQSALSREVEDFRLLGRKLAIRTYSAAKTAPREVLVIAREPGKKGQVYHEAILAGIKDGLASQAPKAEGRAPEVVTELVPRSIEGADPETSQTALLTLANGPLDAICAKHSKATAIICLVPVHQDFDDSMIAQETSSGQKVFVLYTDNVYQLGGAIAYDHITFCITDNPLYRPDQVKPDAKPEDRYAARFLPPIGKNNIRALAGKYRKLFYMNKRLD